MKLQFAKMHGAGNDFIVVDDTPARRTYSPEQIRKLCRRRTGIGADGLISLQALPDSSAVQMSFFNCDGSRASLCGNGLRCAAAFAGKYGLAEGPFIRFVTDSGILCAELLGNNQVRIELPLTEDFQEYPSLPSDEGAGIRMKGYRGVVGVPHFVLPLPDVSDIDLPALGRSIRFHRLFAPGGVNVDFVQDPAGLPEGSPLPIRTYERGVEGETLACGTGIASAACALWKFRGSPGKQTFLCRSGDLIQVEITANGSIVNKIHLTGPAAVAFTGECGDDEEEGGNPPSTTPPQSLP